MRTALTIFALCAILVTVPACLPTQEQLEQARDQTVELRTDLEDLLVELRTERDAALAKAAEATGALKETHEALAQRIEGSIESTQVQVDALVKSEQLITTALEEYGEGGDMIDALAGQIAPWLPYELRAPVMVGGALLGLAARARKSRAALNSLATSTTKAAEKVPAFRDALGQAAMVLDDYQTPAAKKAVDAAQGKRLAMPI